MKRESSHGSIDFGSGSLRHAFRNWQWLSIALVVGVSGCGDPESSKGIIRKASVSGVVTIGGEPVEGAEVYFFTEDFTGFGVTNAEGKYRLTQGAAVGHNKVYISKLEGWNAIKSVAEGDPIKKLHDPEQEEHARRAKGITDGEDSGPKQLIPAPNNSLKTTKLTFDVPKSGAKDADFGL